MLHSTSTIVPSTGYPDGLVSEEAASGYPVSTTAPVNGAADKGALNKGASVNDTAEDGAVRNGVSVTDTAVDGAVNDGVLMNGAAKNGAADDGAAVNGSAGNGDGSHSFGRGWNSAISGERHTVSGRQRHAGRSVMVDGVSVRLGGTQALCHTSISLTGGGTLAILGPSGCGKTTLLRVIAGMQRADSGTVMLGDEIVSGNGTHVSAESRGVGMVFQDGALFPHLTVAANVAFGLPRSERPRCWRRTRRVSTRVEDLLEMLGIADLAHRLPDSLSGGQQQRVALARALAPKPSVLLLDEPFSSLDSALRLEVRTEVALLLRELGITCVFVTHDQDEAFVLGDEVAVMRAGTVVQQAPPAVLYESPADWWVAQFVGEADYMPGRASGTTASTRLGRLRLREPASGSVDVLVRPEELILTQGADATVDYIEFFGHDTLYHVRTNNGAKLRCRDTGAPRFTVGASVDIRHSGVCTVAFPRASHTD